MKNLKDTILESKFENPQEDVIVYNGKNKCFAVINTSDYDGGTADSVAVQVVENSKLADAGFDENEIKLIRKLNVGDSETNFEMDGVVVVRMR